MMLNPDPIVYIDGKERRTLDLRPDGVACLPVLGLSNFQSARTGTEEHVHPGCVEVSLCVRGNLMFEWCSCPNRSNRTGCATTRRD